MPHDFGDYWKCLKKHTKRSQSWVPRARDLQDYIGNRPFRYFTLCALPMIDVFMLARDGILEHDESFGDISEVVFCEENQEDYPQIIEMIGVEGSGFSAKLEKLVLFEDADETAEFSTLSSVQLELENEQLADGVRDALMLKRQHLQFINKFPFDFLNLDFCGYYYPKPPGILEINRTVKRMIDLQSRVSTDQDGREISVDRFVMAVTCRFDGEVPQEAFRRLQHIVRQNRDDNDDYAKAMLDSGRTIEPDEWQQADAYDFFLASWPKELLTIAREHGWSMKILDYMHYERMGDRGPYYIVSLACLFDRSVDFELYSAEAIRVLDRNTRLFVEEVNVRSAAGRELFNDLREIVAIRNERAREIGRPELPPL